MFTNVTIEIAGKHRQGCPLPLLRPHQDLEERVALQLRLQLQLLLLAQGPEGCGEGLEIAIELMDVVRPYRSLLLLKQL